MHWESLKEDELGDAVDVADEAPVAAWLVVVAVLPVEIVVEVVVVLWTVVVVVIVLAPFSQAMPPSLKVFCPYPAGH